MNMEVEVPEENPSDQLKTAIPHSDFIITKQTEHGLRILNTCINCKYAYCVCF